MINPGSQNELVAKARPEFNSLLQRPPSSMATCVPIVSDSL